MVGGAQVPQRPVAFRRQHQGQQPGFQRHAAVDQPDADEDGHHGHRDGADEFQGHGGQERRAQGGHGRFAVGLADVGQRLALGGCAAQANQDRQSAGQLQQMVGEPVQSAGSQLHPLLGVEADQDHEDGHQRHRQHHNQGADPVGDEYLHPDHQGQDGAA